MRFRNLRMCLAMGLIGCAVWLLFPIQAGTQVKSDDPATSWANPYAALNSKAHLFVQEDYQSIRAFADEVFLFPRAFPRMPDTLESAIKDRISHAELAYRRGAGVGVREQDLVKLINDFANKFAAPPYARTNVHQLRVLRMHLVLSSPAFMGKGINSSALQVGGSIGDRMSPLQAVHLVNSMIDQKLINPEYQLSPDEWERTQFARSMESIRQRQRYHAPSSQEKAPPRREAHIYSVDRGFRDSLSKTSSSLGIADGFQLLDEVFRTLGLD